MRKNPKNPTTPPDSKQASDSYLVIPIFLQNIIKTSQIRDKLVQELTKLNIKLRSELFTVMLSDSNKTDIVATLLTSITFIKMWLKEEAFAPASTDKLKQYIAQIITLQGIGENEKKYIISLFESHSALSLHIAKTCEFIRTIITECSDNISDLALQQLNTLLSNIEEIVKEKGKQSALQHDIKQLMQKEAVKILAPMRSTLTSVKNNPWLKPLQSKKDIENYIKVQQESIDMLTSHIKNPNASIPVDLLDESQAVIAILTERLKNLSTADLDAKAHSSEQADTDNSKDESQAAIATLTERLKNLTTADLDAKAHPSEQADTNKKEEKSKDTDNSKNAPSSSTSSTTTLAENPYSMLSTKERASGTPSTAGENKSTPPGLSL